MTRILVVDDVEDTQEGVEEDEVLSISIEGDEE